MFLWAPKLCLLFCFYSLLYAYDDGMEY
jgi:hypothetical protein